jgi:hypothetical protein
VAGVQGRYFIFVMPLLFLGVYGHGWRQFAGGPDVWAKRHRRALTSAAAGLTLAALVLYTAGLLLSYHVPCGSEYYRWSLCNQPQYKNWAPESVSSPPISSTMTLTQEIVPACDGMTELRVWVNSNGGDDRGTTTLLLRAPSREAVLDEATYQNRVIVERGWLRLTFPQERDSDGQLYLLKLSGSTSDGIRVAYSEKPEYMRGRLLENDLPLGQDLLFQYGCVAGLQKTLSPLVESAAHSGNP